MQNKEVPIDEDILFPKGSTTKHPHAEDVIKIAEAQGIGVGDIAEIIGKSQPYISQVKAGKGNLKTEDLQPLIYKLSPKAPGKDFYPYRVLMSIQPDWPTDWEEQVLMTGLKTVSENQKGGRYPTGESTFKNIEKEHNRALEGVDDFGTPARSLSFETFQRPFHPDDNGLIDELSEALAQYRTESEALNKQKKDQEDITSYFISQIVQESSTPIQSSAKHEMLAEKLEEILPNLVENKCDELWGNLKTVKNNLIIACVRTSDALRLPPIVDARVEFDWVKIKEGEIVNDPESHAVRILEKCNELKNKLDEKRLEKQTKFRLTGHYAKKALARYQAISLTSHQDKVYVKNWGRELFGDAVVKVFRSPEQSYEINLTEAFSIWAADMPFLYQEENIQVCGTKLLEIEHNDGKIAIHELHTQQFVVLNTFLDQDVQKDFTSLSEPLSVENLFQHIEDYALLDQWSGERIIRVNEELSQSLLTRGYRVPGVRSVY